MIADAKVQLALHSHLPMFRALTTRIKTLERSSIIGYLRLVPAHPKGWSPDFRSS